MINLDAYYARMISYYLYPLPPEVVVSRTLDAVAKKTFPVPQATEAGLKRLRERRDQLLPIEAQAKVQIDAQIAIGEVGIQFPDAKILDKSVLRWRWPFHSQRATIFKVPIPKLALVNLKDPTFYLERMEHSRQETSVLPSGVPQEYYADILKRLDLSTAFVKRSKLSFTWTGLIPEASVETIREAGEYFGHYEGAASRPRVYLLAEAPHELWSMESEAKEPRRVIDPLILGHKGNQLYVVGSFDPTPLEQYVAAEFTS